jgi:hypothetical protein
VCSSLVWMCRVVQHFVCSPARSEPIVRARDGGPYLLQHENGKTLQATFVHMRTSPTVALERRTLFTRARAWGACAGDRERVVDRSALPSRRRSARWRGWRGVPLRGRCVLVHDVLDWYRGLAEWLSAVHFSGLLRPPRPPQVGKLPVQPRFRMTLRSRFRVQTTARCYTSRCGGTRTRVPNNRYGPGRILTSPSALRASSMSAVGGYRWVSAIFGNQRQGCNFLHAPALGTRPCR